MISGPWQGVNLRYVVEMMRWHKMKMKTKVEMVTCGEDGLAINEGEVLLHGELWWGGHREI